MLKSFLRKACFPVNRAGVVTTIEENSFGTSDGKVQCLYPKTAVD